jgi:peroxiredoxin
MKNVLFLISACMIMAMMMTGCGNQSATSYIITGTIDGLAEGDKVQLIPVSHSKENPVGDTIVVGGKFVFKGVADEPRAMNLVINNAYLYRLMIENRNIKITGKVTERKGQQNGAYSLSEVNVTGSPATDYYQKLLGARNSLDSVYMNNNERFKDIHAAVSSARAAKDKAKMDSIMSTDEYKALEDADKNFFALVKATYRKVVDENRDTFWGPLMMISFTTYLNSEPENREWYESLSQEAQDTYYGQTVKNEIFPVGKIGSEAPVFKVKDARDNEITLTDLCKNKRYILIDFWASWCVPCRREIPNLKKEYSLYATKGLEIISISIDQQKSDWEKALKEENLQWPNFLDVTGIADLYGVRLIPTMYLISADGTIVGDNLRGEALSQKLAELFRNGK